MVALTSNQIDALAIAFTVFASLWLLMAIVYMLTVMMFFRMRSRGALRGSMSSPEWGRVYVLGKCYIPMGWLFRRYIMYQRSGEERERIAKIRVMSVEERRAAIQVILKAPRNHDNNHNNEEGAIAVAGGAAGPTEKTDDALQNTADDIDVSVIEIISDNPQPSHTQEEPLEPAHLAATTMSSDDDDEGDEAPFDEMCHDVQMDAEARAQSEAAFLAAKRQPHLKDLDPASLAELGEDASLSSGSSSLDVSSNDASTHCPICFAAYTEERPHFDSPVCSHRFHWDCILSWLEFQSHRDCPCCRVELVSEEQIWRVVRKMRKNERRRQRRKEEAEGDVTAIRPGATHDEDDDLSGMEEGTLDRGAEAVHSRPHNNPDSVEVLAGEGSSSSSYSVIAFDESSSEGEPNNPSRNAQAILRTSSEPVRANLRVRREQDLVRSQSDVILVRSRSGPVDLDASQNSSSNSFAAGRDRNTHGNDHEDNDSQVEVVYDAANRPTKDENPTLARFLETSAHVSDI